MNVLDGAVALAAGSLTTLSPCVLPMLPVVLGGALQANRHAPLWMGAGMVTTFMLFGVLVGVAGDAIGLDGDRVRQVGAVMLLAMGVVLLVPALANRFAAWMTPVASAAGARATGLDAGTARGAFLLGGLMGMVWSPCSGPLLASTLALVAGEGGALRGGLLLGLFGVGAAVPLVLLAYASRAGFQRVRDRVLARIEAVKRGFGVLLLALGAAILLGLDKRLEAVITQALPEAWVRLTVLF